ncbi:MAG: hypothetical protein ACLUR5_07640 [Eubacterium ventriosum]
MNTDDFFVNNKKTTETKTEKGKQPLKQHKVKYDNNGNVVRVLMSVEE